MRKVVFISTLALALASQNVSSYPWNNNTREHLFGYIDQHNQAQVTIEDEGFRWRNSLNFTINGQHIRSQNWWFNRVVYINNDNFAQNNNFISNVIFDNNNRAISISSNLIHSHLAKIAAKIKQINNCASASVAAVTIVVENRGQHYAFSKMVDLNGKPYVATTTTVYQDDNLQYVQDTVSVIRTDITNVINCNIPNRSYSCSEGKILSLLTGTNLIIFQNIIVDLLEQARTKVPMANFDYSSIKLVVLHIGTTMDPCAVCTRCLVGLSKRINENINNFLRNTTLGAPAGDLNNAKFLVEVSSNGHYSTTRAFNVQVRRVNRQDNFVDFNCGQCSHTECAGHDGGEANPINISLNFFPISGLAIPYVTPLNWSLNPTFPPYVIFGRVNNVTSNVISAPGYNQADGTCNNRGHNMHFRHQCINNLSLVR